MLFVFEDAPAIAVEPASEQPTSAEISWHREPALSLYSLSGAAARATEHRLGICEIYGERDFGYLIQRTLTGKYRYLYYYTSSKRVLKGPLLESEFGAVESALADCRSRGRTHRDTHWADQLRLICDEPIEEVTGEAEVELPSKLSASEAYDGSLFYDTILEIFEEPLAAEEVAEEWLFSDEDEILDSESMEAAEERRRHYRYDPEPIVLYEDF